jgi:hypothetical protein
MNRVVAGVGLAVLAGAVLAPRPAAAYVRYVTMDGIPFYWPQDCVPVTAYPNDLTTMTPDQSLAAASAAPATWSANDSQNACTYMVVSVTGSADPAPPARYDGRNSLIFHSDVWCNPDMSTGRCKFDPAALAITSVFVSTKDGKIRDGDIEVNAKYFVWTDVDTDPNATGKQDLQNALTHEMGHLIGLDHTCYIPGNSAMRPFDNNGNPVPDCDTAPADVRATTMFASAVPGDTTKRTLAPDDQQALCDIYNKASDPMVCPPPGLTGGDGTGCGSCGVAGSGAGRSAGAGLALALLTWSRRRRRSG